MVKREVLSAGWVDQRQRVFGAQRHSDHSAAIYTLAGLWHTAQAGDAIANYSSEDFLAQPIHQEYTRLTRHHHP